MHSLARALRCAILAAAVWMRPANRKWKILFRSARARASTSCQSHRRGACKSKRAELSQRGAAAHMQTHTRTHRQIGSTCARAGNCFARIVSSFSSRLTRNVVAFVFVFVHYVRRSCRLLANWHVRRGRPKPTRGDPLSCRIELCERAPLADAQNTHFRSGVDPFSCTHTHSFSCTIALFVCAVGSINSAQPTGGRRRRRLRLRLIKPREGVRDRTRNSYDDPYDARPQLADKHSMRSHYAAIGDQLSAGKLSRWIQNVVASAVARWRPNWRARRPVPPLSVRSYARRSSPSAAQSYRRP